MAAISAHSGGVEEKLGVFEVTRNSLVIGCKRPLLIYALGAAFSRNHFVLNSSSLEMVPSARHVARLDRFAIKADMPFDNLTKIMASLAGENNTLPAWLCGP